MFFSPEPIRLTYFPVMAKGLGPALICEFSGLPWCGPKDTGFTSEQWPKLKSSGKCPFGQLPMLEADGLVIGQCIAIVNYVGKKANMEGYSPEDFVMSQALLAEAEDLYAALQKFQPTSMVPLGGTARDGITVKHGIEAFEGFWKTEVPSHFAKLEALVKAENRFTSSGRTVGEIYLWSMLHQMKLVHPNMFDSSPKLAKFYEEMEQEPKVQKVLSGESTFGPLKQYFVNPPEEAGCVAM